MAGSPKTETDELVDATELDPSRHPPRTTEVTLARGAVLGRYIVLEHLGGGGMGVVYVAYDPELDRRVVLKLLRFDGGDAARVAQGRARLFREAQAMARLSHPNVISVFDVGRLEDQVFIAMELVKGMTLSQWVKAETRSLREILDRFRQAGTGLAAAHAAGLVHRDFKPDNVLVGDDGRVRVLDFGLARAASLDAEEPPSPEALSPGQSPLETTITRTGALLGTPGYMAPEQIDGRATDARTDQFAFSIAFYEALYGERPFIGDGWEAVAGRVKQGLVKAAPRGSEVPAWLRAVLLRGLSPRADDRWPSMDALLAALARDPARARRRWLGVAALLAVLAVGGFAYQHAGAERSQICRGADARLAAEWNPTRREQLHAGFIGTNKPFAETTWSAFAGAVDRYAAAWVKQRTEACEATQVRGEQSTLALDLRMGCYDQRLREVGALLRVYALPDGDTVARAPEAAEHLPTLDRCADVSALSATLPPPADAPTRARVEALRTDDAETVAQLEAGRYVLALARAQTATITARALGYAPLTAQVLLTLGRAYYSLGQYANAIQQFWESSWAADAGRADEEKVTAWVWLSYVTVSSLAKPEEAALYAGTAEAALARLGEHPTLEGDLRVNRCLLLTRLKEYADALGACDQGLVLRARAPGPETSLYGEALQARGDVLTKLGRLPEALADHRHALAIYNQLFGPVHPKVAIAQQYVALVLYTQGDLRGALAGFEAVLAMRLQLLVPDHPQIAITYANIASTLWDLGRHAEAVPHYERAIAIREKHFGPAYGKLFEPLVGIAQYRVESGQPKEALVLLERALAIGERDKLDASDLVDARFAMAQALWRTSNGVGRARAKQLAEAARAAATTQLAPTIASWLAHPN